PFSLLMQGEHPTSFASLCRPPCRRKLCRAGRSLPVSSRRENHFRVLSFFEKQRQSVLGSKRSKQRNHTGIGTGVSRQAGTLSILPTEGMSIQDGPTYPDTHGMAAAASSCPIAANTDRPKSSAG